MDKIDSKKSRIHDIGLFLLFLGVGTWVFFFGGYLATLDRETRTIIKVATPILLGVITYICYRYEPLLKYASLAMAFTLCSSGLLLAWSIGGGIERSLQLDMTTPRGWALAKVSEATPMVLPALAMLPILGKGYESVFLQKGRLLQSLMLGLGMCLVIYVVFDLISDVGPKIKSTLPYFGWMVLFSVTNGFMEELLLRGLFLRKYAQFFSAFSALLLSTLIFTIMHFGASYLTSDNLITVVSYVFLLGLGAGAIIQRTNNIWGAVLAHGFADWLLLASMFGVAA